MDYYNTFNRNLAYLIHFDQYTMCAMYISYTNSLNFNELYEIIMIEIYCLNTTIYDLAWNYALNHMNLVYFAQTQFITNHNRLSTKQDQTHT